jgi:hypothetical protein
MKIILPDLAFRDWRFLIIIQVTEGVIKTMQAAFSVNYSI